MQEGTPPSPDHNSRRLGSGSDGHCNIIKCSAADSRRLQVTGNPSQARLSQLGHLTYIQRLTREHQSSCTTAARGTRGNRPSVFLKGGIVALPLQASTRVLKGSSRAFLIQQCSSSATIRGCLGSWGSLPYQRDDCRSSVTLCSLQGSADGKPHHLLQHDVKLYVDDSAVIRHPPRPHLHSFRIELLIPCTLESVLAYDVGWWVW